MKYTTLPIVLLSLFCAVFVSPRILRAEITYPYTIDEKPRVLFGDSMPVETYYGLENYTFDYVEGFAHIRFTYTHSFLSLAGYPPQLYITATDPRTTDAPVERSSIAAYQFHPSQPSGWYQYDIQFDALGYRVVVTDKDQQEIFNERTDVSGLTSSDWVSLVNRYPRTAEPSGMYAMSFTPHPIQDQDNPPGIIDPVIIIPGIMGSARKNGKLVIDPILHTYDDLLATLEANGYTKDFDLFTFPYEWRDSNVLSANLLDDKIEEVKQICGCSKVDLVAHSMGGLVARAYVQSVDYNNDVDQLIFLGTPHKGSPKAYLQWEGGRFPDTAIDNLIELFFEAEAIKNGYPTIYEYIRLRPVLTAQELLPVFDYIEEKDSGIIRNYFDNYPRNSFLENLNENLGLLLNAGVRISNIVGNSGFNTIERIRVTDSTDTVMWEHGEPDGYFEILGDHGLERGLGDDTVTPLGSSVNNLVDTEEFPTSHGRLPTIASNRIVKLLTERDSISNIDNGFHLSPKVLLLQLFSPVDFVITDPNGNKIGKDFNTGEEFNQIQSAFYSGYKTNFEYITILDPLDGEYKIELQGTDNGGEYKVVTSYITGEHATSTEYSAVTGFAQISNLIIMIDNQNPQNIEIESVDPITPSTLLSHVNLAMQWNWITNEAYQKLNDWAQSIVRMDNKSKIKFVDKKLAQTLFSELPKLLEKGDINTSAYNMLKKDLEYLMNN